MSQTGQEKPSYTFTPKIPSLQAIPESKGEIQNFTAPIPIPQFELPPRTGKNKPGEKIVELNLPSNVDQLSFLYIHLSEHSEECRKVLCIPGDSGPGTGGGGEPYPSDGGTPDYPTTPPTPEYPTQKPEYPTQKPEYPTQKPEYPTQKPEYPTQKPEYPTQKPEYPTQKPEYPTSPPTPEYPTQKPEYPQDIPKPPKPGRCKFYPKDPSGDPRKGGDWYYPDPDPKKGGEWIPQPPLEQPSTTTTTTEQGDQESMQTQSGSGLELENDLIVIGKSLIKKLGNVKTLRFQNYKDNEIKVQVVAGYDLTV